jgi:glycosyltransferase involved in cell wall biosynthesis
LRIAQIAPLYESVPPRLYGGTERVVSHLTEELVRQGHEVTLFASGDSQTDAELVRCCSQGLRLDPSCRDIVSPHALMVEQVFQRADEFDVLHFHTEPFHYSLARRAQVPSVTTLHGRLDLTCLPPLFAEFRELNVVSISNSQRAPLEHASWAGTVYHGLPRQLLKYGKGKGGYLAFLGRISPEKGPDRAIEIAKRAGMPLKIGAKVDKSDLEYFESIAPLLDQPGIEFVGEIGDDEKQEFLGDATALLFPIDWPEPFGLVMIESLACGTPVIAHPRGSVPEILDHEATAFLVDDIDAAVEAVRLVRSLDRKLCRRVFEERFSVERMARDYVEVYRRTIASHEQEAA